jgi:hypothetical protein
MRVVVMMMPVLMIVRHKREAEDKRKIQIAIYPLPYGAVAFPFYVTLSVVEGP